MGNPRNKAACSGSRLFKTKNIYMKKKLLLIILILQSLVSLAQFSVGNLTTEYLTNPIGIDVQAPRLSWQIKSKIKDLSQSAYQVLVASTLAKLNEQADILNTGKIVSDQSVLVNFNAVSLASGERYYWKVRVWDNKGNSASSSDIAFWEMGLLKKSDWVAKWISAPKVYDWQKFVADRKLLITEGKEETAPPAPEFRKVFNVTKEILKARLYISGVGYNIPFLNGQKVGDHVLDPAFTRYDKTVLYSTFDVTNRLRNGENVLGVVLGNGWYNMTTRAVWGFDHAVWKNDPALRAQLEITYKDGSSDTISSDKSWKVAPGPILFNSIRQGEYFDSRKENTGWNSPDFNDVKWYLPNEVDGPAGLMKAQMIQPIKITETVIPKGYKEPKPGVYVFDLGRDIAGYVNLKIKAPAGTEITFKYAERLNEDGTVNQKDIAQHIAGGRVQTDKYICNGEGTETWHPSFVYHGFQYIEVHGLPVKPEEGTISALVVHTAFDSAGSFQCSNPLFNQIQRNALVSYQSNFMGYPTDCPQREKNGWTGDAHLAAEMGLYNFKAQNGYLKWLQDIADEQRPSGELSAIVPSSGWGYFWGNGPAWDNAMVLIPWYLYEYCGDTRVLELMYPHIMKYVDYLTQRSDNYIISFGLGDWAPAATKTPVEITSTAYYYVDAILLSKMAGILGHAQEEKKYADLGVLISKAFNKKYYKGEGVYASGSQTALSCAIYQGLCGDNLTLTSSSLLTAVKKSKDHLDCGILGTKYLLHALSDNGYTAEAYKIVNQETFPGWGYWIKQGATTLWEQWDGSESHNHIMFGDVSAWFYGNIAGITPDIRQPGFKHIIFNPSFSTDLDWTDASHESMYGNIISSWKRKGSRIYYTVSIPPNSTGEVLLPSNKKIFVDGRKLSKSEIGTEEIIGNNKKIKLMLGSGRYLIIIND